MLAFGMFAKDPTTPLTPADREDIRARLRSAYAAGLPLVLTPQERHHWTLPLLGYLAIHRPRIVGMVTAALHDEKGAG
jgi:hypothetical protein